MSLDLDAIKARSVAATAGPWQRLDQTVYAGPDEHGVVVAETYGDQHDADAIFIAHAREDVPALVAEVERLRKIESAARDIEGWVLANHYLSVGDIAHLSLALNENTLRQMLPPR